MNNIEQAYINGFLKRAAELGFSEEEASNLLDKIAGPTAAPKTMPAKPQIKPQPSVADKNDRAASAGSYVPKPLPNPKTIPLEY